MANLFKIVSIERISKGIDSQGREQHRVTIATQNGVAVYYMLGKDELDVYREATKKWVRSGS